MTAPPYLIEARELEARLPDASLLPVAVGDVESYLTCHPPGAVYLDYNELIVGAPPAPGLPRPVTQLQESLRRIGLSHDKHVIAFDAHGNGRAARLLWTLELLGHARASLLNGGLTAWQNENYECESGMRRAPPGDFIAKFQPQVLAEKEFVRAAIGDHARVILDARSPQEFRGEKSASARHGRIPGAVNLNWTDCIDTARNLRFKPDSELRAMLEARGVHPAREVIVHCQTHHRSSHSFVMLRHLGFDSVRGYAGSWAEWGNDASLPLEKG